MEIAVVSYYATGLLYIFKIIKFPCVCSYCSIILVKMTCQMFSRMPLVRRQPEGNNCQYCEGQWFAWCYWQSEWLSHCACFWCRFPQGISQQLCNSRCWEN